jgi:predicted Zn-dependent protease
MLATERAWAEFGAEVTQHCKEVVDKVAGSDEFIRIETVCLASRQKATDWYPSIGLEFESTLQSYGVNGENAVMYVRTNQPSKSIIEI